MNLLNRIFSSNNDSYTKAKNCLTRVKCKLDSLTESFPDVTIPELLIIDEKWANIPERIGSGISMMTVELNNDFTAFLAHYEPKAYFLPHEHEDNFELNKVIKGSITNKITGETFETGDTFILDKKERHFLIANEESFIYSLLTANEEYLEVPYIKPSFIRRFKQLNQVSKKLVD